MKTTFSLMSITRYLLTELVDQTAKKLANYDKQIITPMDASPVCGSV